MARLVYSSGGDSGDRSAKGNRGKVRKGADSAVAVRAPEEHDLRVSRQRAGRKGKTVTVAAPVFRSRSDAAEMLRDLKKRCGAGGSLKPGGSEPAHWVLELQGDRVDAILDWLEDQGFPAKRSGG